MMQKILDALQERAKELNTLYEVDEILSRTDIPPEEIYKAAVAAIPKGWQFPEDCHAILSVDGRSYTAGAHDETPWCQRAEIHIGGARIGDLAVCYRMRKPEADEGPFLKEERRLIAALADRIGASIIQRRLRSAHESLQSALTTVSQEGKKEWSVVLDFLRRADPKLLVRITRKMINHLCAIGSEEADRLLQRFLSESREAETELAYENWPRRRAALSDLAALTDQAFQIATDHCTEEEIIESVQSWIEEDRASFLMRALQNPRGDLQEIGEAMERFHAASIREAALPDATRKSLRASLLRRLFSEHPSYIATAMRCVDLADLRDVLRHTIGPPRSAGRLGGKAAGLFLAHRIAARSAEPGKELAGIRVPRTWHISSDGLNQFVEHNSLEDLFGRKYMDIEGVRAEYPHIVQMFKSSRFPHDLSNGLSVALDDFADRPIIVRSSSLLEDRAGHAFSGKYKSLFLANQGTKQERLLALQDAIAEVYASIFSPDPLEYRAARGLLDMHEEMGILIQEVVGRRIGRYFCPAFSGVAFSTNEFRWSARIKRGDGLVRLVPGLGTRAVDRIVDDHPVLMSPGQPNLRVNVTPDEIAAYSPKKIDVLDLEENAFVTLDIQDLLRAHGNDYPLARHLVSMVEPDRIRKPRGLEPDWEKDHFVVTFEGILSATPFVPQIGALLNLLRERTEGPVDIEFAHDGSDLYLLQCRAQSSAGEFAPAPIPRDLPRERIVFQANRHISNGRVPDITHIVYVVPEAYTEIEDLRTLRNVGRAVGRLNKLLPRRQFVLIGPGRWGSRGDIKLGVSVTYADINNTAVLMEVARQKGNYQPELSFGTHFFQDLVEGDIRYLPLYPDEEGQILNELFLTRSRNILTEILPESEPLEGVIRVIDVPAETEGKILKILMNADLEEAVGILSTPTGAGAPAVVSAGPTEPTAAEHWRWRLRMAERIAAELDPALYGVKGLYVCGSVKNALARPGSDIDLIAHVGGTEEQTKDLLNWLDGWSKALAEINYLRTGYRSDGLLDVHIVTDRDVAEKSSFAAKIGAITDAARPLPLRNQSQPGPGTGTTEGGGAGANTAGGGASK